MSPPVRIAVIGAGEVGQRYAELIEREPGCSLGAVVDPDEAAAVTAAGRSEAVLLRDVTELDDGSVNAAVIATHRLGRFMLPTLYHLRLPE